MSRTGSPQSESKPLTNRQLGLLALIQSLEPGQEHRLRITCRGKNPWNVSVEHSEMSFGLEKPSGQAQQENPLDVWDLVLRCAEENRLPEKEEAERLKIYGLYARPDEQSFMLRTRIPGCVLTSSQLRGLGRICERYGNGELMLTMRGNLQVRGVQPAHCVEAIIALQECGLTSIGAGANNVRNIIASPTSGLDPEEVLDVRPHARQLHHYILHHPELYGLPHKFNLAFDNGVRPGVFVDKNDLAFVAVRVKDEPGLKDGLYFQVHAGAKVTRGLPSSDSGVLVAEKHVVPYAAGIILLYKYRSEHIGRKRLRLRDVLEKHGLDKILSDAAILADVPIHKRERSAIETRNVHHSLCGAFPQRQQGLSMLGVTVPVGRISLKALGKLASLADEYAESEIRLTYWQNLLLPHVKTEHVPELQDEIEALGFSAREGDAGSSVVACTGVGACPFASTDAKGMGMKMMELLREENTPPINVNINSCTNACAHHTFGEIGLLGIKGKDGGEAYHLFLGKDRPDESLSRPVVRAIPEAEVKDRLRPLLQQFLASRKEEESFAAFTQRVGRDTIGMLLDTSSEG